MVDKKTSAKRSKAAPAADGLPDSDGSADAGIPAQIELRGIETLVPYARNSRTHSDAQVAELAASIDEFGLVGGIVVRDGVIAKGHGTLQGCIKLLKAGKSLYPAPGRAGGARPYPDGQIPIIDASGWTDAQFRAFVIADNRLALNADWNYEMLAVELDDLRDMDFDLNLLGFDQQELNDMIGTSASGPESVEGEDDAPEPPENPVTKLGDVWLLGDHRVMCGDSTDAGSVALLMAGEKADMVFTDPPYGISYSSDKFNGNKGGVTNKRNKAEMIIGDGEDFDPSFLLEMFNGVKEMFVWGYQYYPHRLGRGGIIVWNKKQESEANCPHGDFELCWSKNERNKMCWLKWGGFNNKEKGEGRLHTTQKPIALAEWFFENWGKGASVVVDLFGGSGSTLIACEKTVRRARLMELDERYVDVIVRRWQEFTGKIATLEGDGRTFEQIADERIGATA